MEYSELIRSFPTDLVSFQKYDIFLFLAILGRRTVCVPTGVLNDVSSG